MRGKDIDHHNLVNDLMFTKAITYRPVAIADGTPKDPNVMHLTPELCTDA